ncbi:MAG: hypothetical protein IJ196_02715 [Prevotella sp.]|nr:hypothetical protein [Prevotella sp.]
MFSKLAYLLPLGQILGKCPKMVLSLRYFKKFHRPLNRSNPQLFYDKIFWNSLNTDTTRWSELADKYKVRAYVGERCGKDCLPNLLGVYEKPEDIDIDSLPNSFVVKTNNGCASNILIQDKQKVDRKDLCRKLGYWLRYPYGKLTGQQHYAKISPKVIVEELLIQDGNEFTPLIDYKFYCFDGIPKYCMVMCDRVFNTHDFKFMMYDMEWNPLPEFFVSTQRLKEAERPACFDEMKCMAEKLSAGFNYVRVDLYSVKGKPVFGEMTFMPGYNVGFTLEAQAILGGLMK